MVDDVSRYGVREYSRGRGASFILRFYARVFQVLRSFTLSNILIRYIPSRCHHRFVDIYVLANLAIAVVCLVACSFESTGVRFELAVKLYAWYRLFEVLVLYSNHIIFDEYRALRDGKTDHPKLNYRRALVMALHSYLEIIVWFAVLFTIYESNFHKPDFAKTHPLLTPTGSVYYSVVTITTLGYGEILPKTDFARLLVTFETLIGVSFALVLLARLVGLVPATKREDTID